MKTKKLILVIFLTFIGAIGAYAQKTNVRMQETQARLLDVTSNAYVKVADRQIERTHQRRMDAHQRTSRTGDEWRPGQHPQLCNLYVFAKT